MYILILGANSEMALALARKFAEKEHANFYLASRDMELLDKRAADLNARYGVEARALQLDVTAYETHKPFYGGLNPKPDGVIIAFGYLGDQKRAEQDFQEALKIIETNYLGAVNLLEVIAADFETRGQGFVIGISSVAGERGRASNYLYGSAKAAFTVCLSGLRNRLSRRGAHVLTVLAGFVDTKMTRHLNLPRALTASPEDVADDVYKAFRKKRNVIYTKWYWRWIMFVIKILPEFLFKRLSL